MKARVTMAQIVIDIDDNTYEAIKHEYCISPPQKGLLKVLWDAIKNGTPLPKGHGRLIDEGVLKNQFPIWVDNFRHMELIRQFLKHQQS